MSSSDRGTAIVLQILSLGEEAISNDAVVPAGLPKESVGSFLLGIALAQFMSEGYSIEEVHKVIDKFKEQAFGVPS